MKTHRPRRVKNVWAEPSSLPSDGTDKKALETMWKWTTKFVFSFSALSYYICKSEWRDWVKKVASRTLMVTWKDPFRIPGYAQDSAKWWAYSAFYYRHSWRFFSTFCLNLLFISLWFTFGWRHDSLENHSIIWLNVSSFFWERTMRSGIFGGYFCWCVDSLIIICLMMLSALHALSLCLCRFFLSRILPVRRWCRFCCCAFFVVFIFVCCAPI